MTHRRSLRRLRVAAWFAVGITLTAALWSTGLGRRWPSVYYMTGPSMEPTLAAGKYFLVWSPVDRLARGDLVLFRYADEDGVFHVLRRLVALPHDTVALDSGAVVLNGVRQDWPFRIASPRVWRSELAIEGRLFDLDPWIVPRDSVVVLADSRDMVGWPDSRFIGFVPVSDIVGRATRTLSGRRLR